MIIYNNNEALYILDFIVEKYKDVFTNIDNIINFVKFFKDLFI